MAFNYEKKIGALLAKAEAAGVTEAEREAFVDKALALMVRTGVDEATARAAANGEGPKEKIVTGMVHMSGMYHLGFRSLGNYVVNALGGLRCYSQQHGQTVTVLYVVGFEGDVQRAVNLIDSLKRQAFGAMQKWWREEGRVESWAYGPQEAKKARRSFIVSFGSGVAEKLKMVYGDVVEEMGAGTELAIRDRQSQVDEWVERRLNLRKGRGFETHANGAGIAAGRTADVGQSAMRGAKGELG